MSEVTPLHPTPDDPNLFILRGELRRPPDESRPAPQRRSKSRLLIPLAAAGWLMFGIAAGIAVLPYMRSGPRQEPQERHVEPAHVVDVPTLSAHAPPPQTIFPKIEPVAVPAPPIQIKFPEMMQVIQTWWSQRSNPSSNTSVNSAAAPSRHRRHHHALTVHAPRTAEPALRPPPADPLGCSPALRAEGVC